MTRSSGNSGKGQGSGWQARQPWGSDTSNQQPRGKAFEPTRIDFGRRTVALIIDVAISYFLGIIVALIPFISNFLPLSATMVLYLLSRDFLFEGRGIGKNLMGLQVVDLSTGKSANLLQSVERNIIMLAPFVVLQVVGVSLHVIPIPWLSESVLSLVNLVGMVYCLVVIPLEAYRVYSRSDGLRIGDEIAGTALIEAPMSFQNILPRQ